VAHGPLPRGPTGAVVTGASQGCRGEAEARRFSRGCCCTTWKAQRETDHGCFCRCLAVKWWLGRRGHGPLNIPHNRRILRRAHPVTRRMRERRAIVLRRRWRDLLTLAVLFLVICACLVLPTSGGVQWQGFVVGMCAGLLVAGFAVLLTLLDGSLLRRIGRSVEADVGDELRRTHGVFGVVSSLMFENTDVDHVVLAAGGVWVVEVKWAMTPSSDLEHLWGLQGHLRQVQEATRKVRGLLRQVAPGVPVRALLVLSGPGVPDLADGEARDDVEIVPAMTRRDWAWWSAGREVSWDLAAARPAAQALMRFRDARVAHELARR